MLTSDRRITDAHCGIATKHLLMCDSIESLRRACKWPRTSTPLMNINGASAAAWARITGHWQRSTEQFEYFIGSPDDKCRPIWNAFFCSGLVLTDCIASGDKAFAIHDRTCQDWLRGFSGLFTGTSEQLRFILPFRSSIHKRSPVRLPAVPVSRNNLRQIVRTQQRRNATIRAPRHFLRPGPLKLITKNSRTVGGSLPPVGPPVTRRSSHPIVTPQYAVNAVFVTESKNMHKCNGIVLL